MKNRRELFRYAQLLLGSAILAFGLFNVHSQSRITEGGVLGMVLLLDHHFGIPPWLLTAVLDAAHRLPPGGVALYYLKPGQTDYTEAQKVYAKVTAPGIYTFDLGGQWVTGLRIDPDSVGGVPTRLDGVVLNPVQPWYLRFVPNGGQWLLLLFAPAVGAAFACLAVDVFRKK